MSENKSLWRGKLLPLDLHKRKLVIVSKRGDVKHYSIKTFIPMVRYEKGAISDLFDVEVLLCKKRNIYFSMKKFIDGESWVSEVHILDGIDKRIKNIPVYNRELSLSEELLNKKELFFKYFLNKVKGMS